MTCPEEQVLVEYFGARAPVDERERVAAHVDGCAECRQTLSALAQAPDLELDSALPAPLREPLLDALLARGELDGKYRFSRLIGAGGMGVVVEAEHVALHQKVAIKFMRPSLKAHRSAEKRFLAEARHSAQLKSPYVVRVSDVGYAPGRLPYFVMEMLEGEDLERHLTRGLPPLEQALRYCAQVLDALAEAHGLALIHRDLKPANLFLTRQPNGTRAVKVLDFGLARPMEEDGSSAALTQTGTLIGSPLYMAPEQLKASPPVDARTDLWGLGCVMYRMLTGRLPFVADSLGEVLARIQRDAAVPMRQLRPNLPVELEALVASMLEKSLLRRPASVAEVALRLMPLVGEDVKALLLPLATRGAAAPAPVVAAPPARMPRWPFAVGGLALAVALGLTAWKWSRPIDVPPPVVITVPAPGPAPAPAVHVEVPPVQPAPAAVPAAKRPKPKPPRPVDKVYDQRD